MHLHCPPQYTSRPFIVGDRVQLKSLGGSTIAEGESHMVDDK